MKFRKKPVVIDAIKWDGKDTSIDGIRALNPSVTVKLLGSARLLIQTLEGELFCQIEDWVIKGVKGELYPCRNDIFEKTYEPVIENMDINNVYIKGFEDGKRGGTISCT